jgi:hypothetical protein
MQPAAPGTSDWPAEPAVGAVGRQLPPPVAACGLLSVVAGSADVIRLLGLGGLFTAHVTGNLAILAAHPGHREPDRCRAAAVGVGLVVVLALTRLLAVAAGQSGVGGQPGQGQREHGGGEAGDGQAADGRVLEPSPAASYPMTR